MPYITLGGACLLFSFQFLFYKLYQLRTDSSLKSALWMTIFNGVWLFLLFFSVGGFSFHITLISGLYALAYSFFIILCNIVTLFAIRTGNIAMVSLFMLTGGLFLPVIYGVVLLGETLNFQKAIGLTLILLSFFSIALLKKQPSNEGHLILNKGVPNWLLCCIIFICNGMISIVTKAYSINVHATTDNDFLIFTALIQLIAGLILIGGLTKYKKSRWNFSTLFLKIRKPQYAKKVACLFLIVGGFTLCNGIANLLSLVTAKVMASSLQFPILSAAVIVLTTLISWVAYKEKPFAGDTIAIVFTLAGIAIMII